MLTDIEIAVLDRLLEEGVRRFGKAPLERLADAIAAGAGRREVVPLEHPLQRPGGFHVPGLTAKIWYDPKDVPSTAILERNAAAIKAELLAALAKKRGFQHFDEGPEGFTAEEVNYAWKALYFRWNARDVPRNHELCPETARVLASIPDYATLGLFSALDPQAHITPHCGPVNLTLTVHLGLVIPEGCGLRAGDETRTWTEGKCLVFDDSFEHEAWNRGTRTRFILLIDLWRPELTEIERKFLQRAFAEMEIAKEAAGMPKAVDIGADALTGKDWWK